MDSMISSLNEGIDNMENVPMTPSGVGNNPMTKWIYSEYGQFLSVYGIYNKISITFNLNSASDIDNKLKNLRKYRDAGYCSNDDVSELEERLRTLSNFTIRNGTPKSQAGISESSERGKVDTVYRDGKAVKVKRRGKCKISTDAQRNAAENARKYAHTDEANKKRRKSISARSDGKILGDLL